MTEDLYSELLTRDEMVWLAAGEVPPHSPLASFAGLADATEAQSPTARGLSGELWNQAFAVLRDPYTRVRVVVPGATHSFVQYFLGGGPEVDGLVGCWLEGDGMRVSFPWSETDVVSLVSQSVFASPPETAEIDPMVLSVEGLAALGAAVDAIRSQYFAAMADRKLEGDYQLDRTTLAEQNTAGSESTDARWLVPMLLLTGLIPPASDDGIGRGAAELVEAGLLVAGKDECRPGPELLTLSSWWRDPLPAVSCETTKFDTGRLIQHEQRVIIRGNGPLCVMHRTGGPAAAMPITIGTVAPLEYFEEMTRAIRRLTSTEPEFVHVVEPTVVRDLTATTAVAGYLQPGRWYQVNGEAGAWASVKDPNGPLEGWAPAGELYRWVSSPDEIAAIESEPEPSEAAWAATHVVPAGGMRSWAVPDGATDSIADLAAGVELQVTEWRTDWARVRAENGWEAWLDGRRLVAIATQVPDPQASPPVGVPAAAAAGSPVDPAVAAARARPVPPPTSTSGSGSRHRYVMMAVGIGAAAVLAVVAFLSLTSKSSQDTAASDSTSSSQAVSTSAVATTIPATTAPPTATSTTVAPVALTVGHWVHSSVHLGRDDAGVLFGFEVDLINELMARMAASAEWTELNLVALYEGIDAGQFDVAVGGLSTTAVRLEGVPFTIPYFERQYGLIVDPRDSASCLIR